MASFLLLGVVLTTVFLLVLSKINKSWLNSKHPPGTTGWPILGESLHLASSPAKFVRDRMKKYSPDVFQTSIAGSKMVVFCGASGNKFIYSNEDKFRFWLPPSVTNVLSLLDTDNRLPSMKLYMDQLHKFFRLETMQDYVPFMDTKTRDHLEKNWVPYNEVKVQPLAKDFTFSLVCHLLISCNADPARELAEPFFTLAERILSVPVNLPGTPYNQALKASSIVRSKLIDMIQSRKAELSLKADHVDSDFSGQDLLSRVLIAFQQEGHSIGDEELAGLIISILFGGFHTTSTAITFLLGYLAEYPDVYEKVLQEQLEIAQSKRKGEMLTWKDIQKMKYSWNATCETMRLKPPALGGMREALVDVSYAGFTVPKGWKAFWNVNSTHMDPNYFPNPEEFDPSRFEKRFPPQVFVPFGGGAHMCCGREFARIEILVFLHNVVTRFRLSRVNPKENIVYRPHPFPVEGLRIHLQPHE